MIVSTAPLDDTEMGVRLKKQGIYTFDDAIQWVNRLPYGRNETLQITCILDENKGTCSTKHAFLAFLGKENNLPVHLMLGYYHMNRENTPQIGNILEKYKLPFILEAHCYLQYQDKIVDVTFPGDIKHQFDVALFNTEKIVPEDLHLKPKKHKAKLKEWLKKNPNYPLQDINQLWKIREYCIQSASLKNPLTLENYIAH